MRSGRAILLRNEELHMTVRALAPLKHQFLEIRTVFLPRSPQITSATRAREFQLSGCASDPLQACEQENQDRPRRRIQKKTQAQTISIPRHCKHGYGRENTYNEPDQGALALELANRRKARF